MNNKHSSCARNRNENRTVIFYARKHGMAPPAALPECRAATVCGESLAAQVFFPHRPQPLERAAEVS